ncbi:MAG: hypothetical protein Cons2KO_06920 [Congregibacter sp.]
MFSFMAFICLTNISIADDSDVVVSDQGVEITRAEFREALATTAPKVTKLAANDLGDRLEVINTLLVSRKLAQEADRITPEDPDYWRLQMQLISVKSDFVFDRTLRTIKVPDVEALAREYYKTQNAKYATKPEKRASSHILLASRPGLPREGVRAEAQALLDRLRAGEDFEAMVAEYSDDKGSKKRGGALDRWITFGDKTITPPYSEALFEIDEVGSYSEITDSEYGIHIIRLDGIEEAGILKYEEVRAKILDDIVRDFRSLAQREIRARYEVTDDAFVDGDAMDELFEPYK